MDDKWGKAGMNAYLEKPFLPEKLAKALDEHLFM
jgi:CheY-like chemotaxis protein